MSRRAGARSRWSRARWRERRFFGKPAASLVSLAMTKWTYGLLFLAACGSIDDAAVDGAPPQNDAETTPDAAAPRCDVTAPFGDPEAVAELNHPEAPVIGWDEYARLSPDELTLYYGTGRDAHQLDIYVAARDSIEDEFREPVKVSGVNDPARHERTPTVSADGLTLIAMRSGDADGYQIVMSRRSSVGVDFGPFEAIAGINSAANDGDTYLLPDGSALYFYSARDDVADIYRAPRSGSGFGPPAKVGAVDVNLVGIIDGAPVVTADERTIYFSSDRMAAGDSDIFVATRTSLADGFGPAQRLDRQSTTDHWEWPTWISADGCALYFTRSESLTAANYDIYRATRPAP
jgi:hypothetical protein